jgi:hypothetical protein
LAGQGVIKKERQMLTALVLLAILVSIEVLVSYVPAEVGRDLYALTRSVARALWNGAGWRFWMKTVAAVFVLTALLGCIEDTGLVATWPTWGDRFLNPVYRTMATVHLGLAVVGGLLMYRLMTGVLRRREQLAVKAVNRLYRPVVTPPATDNVSNTTA